MDKSLLITHFVGVLAEIRSIMRLTHIELEKLGVFTGISTNITPFQTQMSDGEYAPTLNFSIDAEWQEYIDPDQASIGIQLILSYDGSRWTSVSEFGVSGSEIGWENFYDSQIEFTDSEAMMKGIIGFARKEFEAFDREVRRRIG